MFVKVINFLCQIRGHCGRTEEDGCQSQNSLSAFIYWHWSPMSPQHRALTWAPALPTHSQRVNQQRLWMGQKEEHTDERNVKRKIEIEGQDVEKNDTERQNERGRGNCTKGLGRTYWNMREQGMNREAAKQKGETSWICKRARVPGTLNGKQVSFGCFAVSGS